MNFSEFRRFVGRTPEQLVAYFVNQMNGAMRQLFTGLRNLSFVDNFSSFMVEDLLVPAATEVRVTNGFTDGSIPTHYLIVNQYGAGQVVRSATDWTSEFVYVQNVHSTEDALISIVFLR